MAKQTINKFWNFTPANSGNNEPAELILYGEISSTSWWGDAVTPKQFSDDLIALGDVSEIVVRINSGGGDVFAANAIYTRLKDHKAHITVKVDGWAASAATIIAMAGDVIQIPANGVFMIHDPKMGVLGYYSAEEFVKLSEELKIIKQSIINGYALKTGKTTDEISELMTQTTWYDGQQAVESGFCDELMFEEVETEIENSSRIIVNSVPLDVSCYPNIPTMLLNSRMIPANHSGCLHTSNSNSEKESVNTMGEKANEIKNYEELMAVYPEFTNQIATCAANNERKRIKDIEDIALDGFDSIIQDAKFEKPVNAAEVAMQIVAEQKKQGANYIEGRDTDVKSSGINGIVPDGYENPRDVINPYDAAIDKVLPKTK